MFLSQYPTLKRQTVTTVDFEVDACDLQFTVSEPDSYEEFLSLTSGERTLVVRKDDLAALADWYPAPAEAQ